MVTSYTGFPLYLIFSRGLIAPVRALGPYGRVHIGAASIVVGPVATGDGGNIFEPDEISTVATRSLDAPGWELHGFDDTDPWTDLEIVSIVGTASASGIELERERFATRQAKSNQEPP